MAPRAGDEWLQGLSRVRRLLRSGRAERRERRRGRGRGRGNGSEGGALLRAAALSASRGPTPPRAKISLGYTPPPLPFPLPFALPYAAGMSSAPPPPQMAPRAPPPPSDTPPGGVGPRGAYGAIAMARRRVRNGSKGMARAAAGGPQAPGAGGKGAPPPSY